MRKFIQKQLIDLIDTVKEGIFYAASIHNDAEKSEKALIDCYSAFAHIKATLSENLTTDVFVKYDEFINEIQNDLEILNESIREKRAFVKILDLTKKNIDALKEALKCEKTKIEAVFLPYKASMWDSLESVWMAAAEDENCNTYVIPIPYFDRNADFSLGEMRYEGDLFPSYVPITHYEKYNFEAHHPDIIFIHNPYDDTNYVTCVHPFFHSKNIKKYTDKLVYIPYFILSEKDYKKENLLKSIEAFAITPGVLNADVTVVQSENIRQAYIEILSAYTKDYIKAKEIFEKKILGIGSPKCESVAKYKLKQENIPNDWKKIIGDGRKKIILYNTHLGLLTKNNYERFFIKLKAVLRFFKSRNDVILLWRPHPLALSTAASMNPKAFEEYYGIVEQYKNEKWGIYDDTSDMNRAIALSDAYYGSNSSVLTLYKLTGKPVLIHNLNVLATESELDLI